MRNFVLKSSNGIKWHAFNAAEGTATSTMAFCGYRAGPRMQLWRDLPARKLPKKRHWCEECAAKAPQKIKGQISD